MATAQKRGFRFPWGADARRHEPAPEHGTDESLDQGELAQRLGAGEDELGVGPFASTAEPPSSESVEESSDSESSEPEGEAKTTAVVAGTSRTSDEARPRESLNLDQAAWPQSDRRTAGPLATPMMRRGVAPAAEPEPEVELAPAADARPASEPEAVTDARGEADGRDELAALVESTAAPAEGPAAPSGFAPGGAASPRRANPLVAGLVRAMRDAAKTARDETVAALHVDAAAKAEAIRSRSALNVGELKKAAEADISAVKEWSRAELVRVREETEARIAARRTRLGAETEAEGQAVEDLLGRLEAAVHGFETEMTAFFEALLAEDDPARLAGLAERMPAAPALEEFPTLPAAAEPPTRAHRASQRPSAAKAPPDDRALASPGVASEPVDAREGPVAAEAGGASSAPGEVTALGQHGAGASDDAAPQVESPSSDGPPSPGRVPAEPDVTTSEATDPRADWLDHLDSDAAAAAEAEALAGLDRQTTIVVSGLSNVASIAAFKAALVHVDGVTAVSVTAGANNEVLYTVTHDARTELRDAVRSIEAFEIHLIADDGDTLAIAAREPAA